MDTLKKVDSNLNIPNQLTVSRFILAFIIMFCLNISSPFSNILALILFILAAVTDAIDGFLARNIYGCTTFGKLMDPLADKVLLAVVFIGLIEHNSIQAWMTAIIISRELMVTGLRLILIEKNIILAADRIGKIKTIIQMTAAILYLCGLYWCDTFWLPTPNCLLADIVGLIVVFITVVSGISYFYSNRKYIL